MWSKAAILVYAEHHTILLSESNHLRAGLDVGYKWLLRKHMMSAFDSPLDQWWPMSCMRGDIDCIEVAEGENVLRVVCDERIREELVSP